MYAIIATGGKQYRVSQGDVIYVEKLNNEVNDEVTFPVLMLGGDTVEVGNPVLAGATVTGFLMAIYMANAGGAWDNAKKYIEAGNFGGKGGDCHKAGVVGDTVGDPFKDTSGPAINILIKLLSMVSIVFAGLIVNYSIF